MCGESNFFLVEPFLISGAGSIWFKDTNFWRHSVGWSILFAVIGLMIFISGVIGNGMVILVIYRKPQMRTVTNIFILNLAVADILVILLCVPGTIITAIFTPWFGGSFLCKAVAYGQGVAVFASAYSLLPISLNRCLGLYSPLHRRQGLSKSQAAFFMSLIWVSAFLLMLPRFIFVDVTDTVGMPLCVDHSKDSKMESVHIILSIFFCYGLPLLLMSTTNLIIWCKVSRRKIPPNSASIMTVARIHFKTKNGVRRKLVTVTCLFMLSWLPLYALLTRVFLFHNWEINEKEVVVLNVLIPLAQMLGTLNSSVNPVIYAFQNPKFRTTCKLVILRKRRSDLFMERRPPIHKASRQSNCEVIDSWIHRS